MRRIRAVLERFMGAWALFLDALLPRPWSEDDLAPTEVEARRRREKLRLKRFEKSGHGGSR